jgi:hypothetical protein
MRRQSDSTDLRSPGANHVRKGIPFPDAMSACHQAGMPAIGLSSTSSAARLYPADIGPRASRWRTSDQVPQT